MPAEPRRPEKDRVVFFQRLAMLFVRYIQVFRQLEKVYDQVVHPQKRTVIRAILEGVIGRVLELKNEMVEKEFSEYHYMDDVLHDLKLTPTDLEIPIPRYFISERSKELQERKAMLAEILKMVVVTESPEPLTTKHMSQEEAIKIIQVVERARQGRLRAKLKEESRRMNRMQRTKDPGPAAIELATISIQKVLKGYIQRKKTKIAREEEMIFLGMAMDPKYQVPCAAVISAQASEACTRRKREEHHADYQKSVVAVTNQLREVEGHDMSKAMKDQLRQWFIECRDQTGSFPDYPDDEDGGSALIFAEKSPTQLLEEIAAKEEEESNSKPKGKDEKKEKGKKDKKKENEEVDEQMRLELAEWKLTVDKDRGGKAKGNAKELVEQGLLKQANIVRLQDYLGDYNYLGTTLRQNDIEPMPSLSDVRQVLSLYAILPLGSQVVHEKATLIKAILLAGPAGVGKKMLVHAICQETGANLFDLSPLNTAGKYPGKSGLAMMLHMVFKLDPKRLKKDLPKSLKLIKGEDRVLIVGTTKDPLSADIKSLCKMYSKILLIPRPDYGSRYILWKQLITKQGGDVTGALDFSSLAKVSDGYTPGHMVQVVKSIVTKRRILQQANRPLTAAEFVAPLAKIDPVFQEEEEALKNWYAKTPLGKKRIKAATGKDEEPASVKGKNSKNKKK
ncbi:IQ and AAA domain-containing protein 1-like [Liparis tanakae]|uniref:IQ and AAA domain-containing protein 1-like n=1 Tax=Liparis tanakae TaxID=230148 RepID=A0A4Z2JJF8_9TELE|nr:IQ and AAA domain-containing protein 1-like [Liparis tanakae]